MAYDITHKTKKVVHTDPVRLYKFLKESEYIFSQLMKTEDKIEQGLAIMLYNSNLETFKKLNFMNSLEEGRELTTTTISNVECMLGGCKPANEEELFYLLNHEVCSECLKNDHVYADYIADMSAEHGGDNEY